MRLSLQKGRLLRSCGSLVGLVGLGLWASCQTTLPQTSASQPHSLDVSLSSCDASALIQALAQANAAGPGPHQIALQSGCTYTLSQPDNFWYGPNGLPPISSDITIVGNGAVIERSSAAGTPGFRFFYVAGALTPTVEVGGQWGLNRGRLVLMDLTLRGGLAKGGNGGAIGGGGMGAGGAMFMQGEATLLRVTISGCRAEGGKADSAHTDQWGGGGMGGDGGLVGGGGFHGAGDIDGGDFLGLGEGGKSDAGGAGQGPQSASSSTGAGPGLLGGSAFSNGFGSAGGNGGAGASSSGGGAGFGGAGYSNDGSPGGGGFGGGGGSRFFMGSGPSAGGGGGVGGGGGYGAGGGFGGGGGGGGVNRSDGGQGGFGGGGGGGGASSTAITSVYGGGTGGSGVGSGPKGGGGGMGAGGAIFVHQGALTAVNSTLAENTAQGGNGGTNQGGQGDTQGGAGSGRGGAIFNLNGSVRLLHATVARNTVAAGTPGAAVAFDSAGATSESLGGAVYNLVFGLDPINAAPPTASLVLQNSILADSNGGPDLVNEQPPRQGGGGTSATVDASAPNIIESQVAILTGSANTPGTPGADPKLGGLANNGGLTQTLAAPTDSPAADAADRILCADPLVQNRDQRNLFRPNCGCSLGAFEAKAAIHQQGEACTANSECSTCFCVDGVCCDSACGNSDHSICQACSVQAGAPQDGTCALRLQGQVCRPSVDRFDPEEVCDGEHIECPPNVDSVVLSHKGGGGLSAGCTALPGGTVSPPIALTLSLLLAGLAFCLSALRRLYRRAR